MKKKYLLMTAIAIFELATITNAQVPSYVPTNGLVGFWPFNGNANDESGNGNNGTTGSGVTLTTDRFFSNNSAYDFNGSGNISLTSLPTTGAQDFTISGWVKTNNISVRKGIACWGQDNPWNSTYFFITNNGYLKFDFAYNGGPQSSTFIANNQWHHVAVTCISGLIQLYLDGQPTATALQMNPNISGANKALGANIVNSSSNNFVGSLDDIGIWNRALTQQEITALYTATPNNGGGGNNNTASASVPQGISYQAVARNAQGQPLSNTALQVKFTLLADSLNGATEYTELHTLETNDLGLFSTAFGTGTPLSGTFAGINWAGGNKYLQVEIDAGAGFIDLGAQQLLSVPYSMRSNTAAKAGTIENAGLPVYSDNAAALAGGLQAGQMYRTSAGVLMVVF